jgi:hypothetical protein
LLKKISRKIATRKKKRNNVGAAGPDWLLHTPAASTPSSPAKPRKANKFSEMSVPIPRSGAKATTWVETKKSLNPQMA